MRWCRNVIAGGIAGAVLAGLAVAAITGAPGADGVATTRPVHTIGFEGPLSGPYAKLGINAATGAGLAVRHANANSTRVGFARSGNIARRFAPVNIFQDRRGSLVEIGDIRRLP